MKTRIPSILFTFLLLGATTSACNEALLDLGANDVDAGGATLAAEQEAGLTSAKAGCTEWIDDDIHLAAEGECAGTCSPSESRPAEGTHFALPSMKRFIDLTGGAWLRCSGTFGPDDTVGVEFAPGCRLFFLRYDGSGQLTRGTEIRHQGVLGIYDPATSLYTRRIDLKTTEGGTVSYDVSMQTCPKALVLTPTTSLPGRSPTRVVLRPARERDGGPPTTFPR